MSAGAKADMPVADMFWGDRFGQLTDPFGHKWNLATHKENLTPEEMRKRSGEFFAQMASGQVAILVRIIDRGLEILPRGHGRGMLRETLR